MSRHFFKTSLISDGVSDLALRMCFTLIFNGKTHITALSRVDHYEQSSAQGILDGTEPLIMHRRPV
jgi:hypothetical protein